MKWILVYSGDADDAARGDDGAGSVRVLDRLQKGERDATRPLRTAATSLFDHIQIMGFRNQRIFLKSSF